MSFNVIKILIKLSNINLNFKCNKQMKNPDLKIIVEKENKNDLLLIFFYIKKLL